jgi:hypothetical protein
VQGPGQRREVIVRPLGKSRGATWLGNARVIEITWSLSRGLNVTHERGTSAATARQASRSLSFFDGFGCLVLTSYDKLGGVLAAAQHLV